ncbi:MAG: HypC/HybG/HupF family hydrogenase formation chaperone [Zoogloeaceae bacterium]|nr:HypC/HybG/HupF family hydrogenase formation chaperone [Zoogloeaceae bacterium]
MDPPQPGDWLMSFLGTAREVVSEEEAKATLAVLAQLAAA